MKNYLSNLVEKVLNPAPAQVIHPYRVSLFAPSPYSSGAVGKPEAAYFSTPDALEDEELSHDAQPTGHVARHGSSMSARNPSPEVEQRGERNLLSPTEPPEQSRETRVIVSRVREVEEVLVERNPRPRAMAEVERRETGLLSKPQVRANAETPTGGVSSPVLPRQLTAPPPPETISAPRRAAHQTSLEASPPEPPAQRGASDAASARRRRIETVRPNVSAEAWETQDANPFVETLKSLRQRQRRDDQEARQIESERTHASDRKPSADNQSLNRLAAQPAGRLDRESPDRQQQKRRRALEPFAQPPPPLAPAPAPASLSVRRRKVEEAPGRTPAPTIQVTIGRIEVRATYAAPAARRSMTSQPLGLDEYLRQRDGGQR